MAVSFKLHKYIINMHCKNFRLRNVSSRHFLLGYGRIGGGEGLLQVLLTQDWCSTTSSYKQKRQVFRMSKAGQMQRGDPDSCPALLLTSGVECDFSGWFCDSVIPAAASCLLNRACSIITSWKLGRLVGPASELPELSTHPELRSGLLLRLLTSFFDAAIILSWKLNCGAPPKDPEP